MSAVKQQTSAKRTRAEKPTKPTVEELKKASIRNSTRRHAKFMPRIVRRKVDVKGTCSYVMMVTKAFQDCIRLAGMTPQGDSKRAAERNPERSTKSDVEEYKDKLGKLKAAKLEAERLRSEWVFMKHSHEIQQEQLDRAVGVDREVSLPDFGLDADSTLSVSEANRLARFLNHHDVAAAEWTRSVRRAQDAAWSGTGLESLVADKLRLANAAERSVADLKKRLTVINKRRARQNKSKARKVVTQSVQAALPSGSEVPESRAKRSPSYFVRLAKRAAKRAEALVDSAVKTLTESSARVTAKCRVVKRFTKGVVVTSDVATNFKLTVSGDFSRGNISLTTTAVEGMDVLCELKSWRVHVWAPKVLPLDVAMWLGGYLTLDL